MEMVHAIDGFLPMRWVEYEHEEVPISMDKYSIHGRNILSMDLKYPWVPCNKCIQIVRRSGPKVLNMPRLPRQDRIKPRL